MRPVLALVALVACSAPPAPIPATVPPPAPAPTAIPRPQFGVVPAELGDPGVLGRVRARVIVRRWSRAWMRADGGPLGSGNESTTEVHDIVPVLDATARRLRLVIEDDDARYAPWIDRGDATPTVLAETTVGSTTAGVTLTPGAPLELGAPTQHQRRFELLDAALAVHGTLPADRVGLVFVAPPADRPTLGPPTSRHWTPSKDGRPGVRITARTEIHAAASPTSAVLATVGAEDLLASEIARRDGWVEIELQRPFVRVRGHVAERTVSPDTNDLLGFGTGSGHGFGVSHAVSYDVETGTCLYDRVDGEVIGVTLTTRTRLGGRLGGGGFASVYIDSPWGVADMFLKNLETDPGAPPRWESCTEPLHRD